MPNIPKIPIIPNIPTNHQRDSCLAIIPNACSAKLQPLHQTIKEKFKVRMTNDDIKAALAMMITMMVLHPQEISR